MRCCCKAMDIKQLPAATTPGKTLKRMGEFSRLINVASGFEHESSWAGDHVDHGDEGCIVAVATGPGASGLKQAVQARRIRTGRRPASDDGKMARWQLEQDKCVQKQANSVNLRTA